jgi:hypothetical protein
VLYASGKKKPETLQRWTGGQAVTTWIYRKTSISNGLQAAT